VGTRRQATGPWLAGVLAVLAASAAAATAALPASPAGASTTAGAATLYQQALATTKAWSVHYASSSTASKITLVETGNAGPASGIQEVSMGPSAQSQPDTATIEVIGGITYLKGNEGGLQNLAGFSAAQAMGAAGQWIQFATNNTAFAGVVAGVRSSDLAKELVLKGPLKLGRPRTVDGYRVDAIEGTQKFAGDKKAMPVVLYVRASGKHLPVEEDALGANGQLSQTEHVTYSGWGETVRPLAPHATVSIGHISTT
jgi:hypothetical protein